MFRYLFLLFTCFVLSGCTVITLTYFRNFNKEPVEVWFIPDESNYTGTSSYTGSSPTHFFYSKNIEPVRARMWKQMKDSLPIVRMDKAVIISIPPNSTALMPRGIYNGNIYIRSGIRTDTVWLDKIDRTPGFRYKSGGFPISSILYYDHF